MDEGNWKARQGGNGIEVSKNTFVSFKPCATEQNSFNYDLKRPIMEQLYEFFKPFGWISKELGNQRLGEVYVVNKNKVPILRIQGRIGTKVLKVSVLKLLIGKAKSVRKTKMKIECQLTKYQMCMACLACESICKHDAINISKATSMLINQQIAVGNENNLAVHFKIAENKYYINDNKCVRCGDCINHFDGGCYMRKVLITKRGE